MSLEGKGVPGVNRGVPRHCVQGGRVNGWEYLKIYAGKPHRLYLVMCIALKEG